MKHPSAYGRQNNRYKAWFVMAYANDMGAGYIPFQQGCYVKRAKKQLALLFMVTDLLPGKQILK